MGDQRDLAEVNDWLARALARQGKLAEAATTVAPAVKLQRALAPRNHGDQRLPLEFASAVYVQALADPKAKPARRPRAATLVDGLAPEVRALRGSQQWRERIHEALK